MNVSTLRRIAATRRPNKAQGTSRLRGCTLGQNEQKAQPTLKGLPMVSGAKRKDSFRGLGVFEPFGDL
jgi:hypothetical protein